MVQKQGTKTGYKNRVQKQGTKTGYRKMGKSSIFSNCLSFSKSINFSSKKGIVPVVATALLLVVAVVAAVGFQTWFGTYSSGLFSKTETTSNYAMGGSLKIETLVGNNLYINNKIADNLNVTSLKIGGKICNLSNLTLGMNTIDVSNCISNLTTSTPEIVLITGKQVVSKKVYVSGVTSTSSTSTPSLDCSSLKGGLWIKVPGNTDLGTSDFCVMKYETKWNGSGTINDNSNMYCGNGNDDGTNNCPTDGSVGITSKAEWKPLTQVNQKESRKLCANLGAGYHLITNAEWTTIARNIENVASNWNSSQVGVGVIFSGNTGVNGAGSYDGAGPENSSNGVNDTGKLVLSNGEIIWDLSGNVWEWNNDTTNSSWYNSSWIEWTNSSLSDYEKPHAGSSGNYDSTNGIGRYYGNTAIGNGFLRGGDWNSGANAGAFALSLYQAPLHAHLSIGFRCSYSP